MTRWERFERALRSLREALELDDGRLFHVAHPGTVRALDEVLDEAGMTVSVTRSRTKEEIRANFQALLKRFNEAPLDPCPPLRSVTMSQDLRLDQIRCQLERGERFFLSRDVDFLLQIIEENDLC